MKMMLWGQGLDWWGRWCVGRSGITLVVHVGTGEVGFSSDSLHRGPISPVLTCTNVMAHCKVRRRGDLLD